MKRALSLWLCAFAIDGERTRRGSRAPLLLVARAAGRRLVVERCEQSAARGVRVGMSPSEALALLGDASGALVAAHDPERDRLDLARLGAAALELSPKVALDPPDGLVLDVAGCERLFGGEAALVDAALAFAAARGFRARAAVAPTLGCAWALARFAREQSPSVARGDQAQALARLPVRALRLDAKRAEELEELGIESVAALCELPRDELAARFGADVLVRLDQALGRAPEPMTLVRPAPPLRATRVFEGPVDDLQALTSAVHSALDEVLDELERRGEGALELVVELACADAPSVRSSLVLSRASRDRAHLWRLLLPRVEAARVGFGVERVVVGAPRTAVLAPRQAATFAAEEGALEAQPGLSRALGELLDVLAGRFGAERVLRAELVASHVPECSYERRSYRAAGRALHAAVPFARPSLLFDPPRAIDVRSDAPDGTPARIGWRGALRDVGCCLGPERIAAPWWGAGERWERDYFRALLADGAWLWIYREPAATLDRGPRWFAHGEWV